MIERTLVLSTGHVDPEFIVPEFSADSLPSVPLLDCGDLRSVAHKYGWIVFVYPECDNIPSWIRPIHDEAVRQEVTLILFDSGADAQSQFPVYEW